MPSRLAAAIRLGVVILAAGVSLSLVGIAAGVLPAPSPTTAATALPRSHAVPVGLHPAASRSERWT